MIKNKIITFIVMTLFFVVSSAVFAASIKTKPKRAEEKKLDKKIMGYVKEVRSKNSRKIDKAKRKEIRDYIMSQKGFTMKDFHEHLEAGVTAYAVIGDFSERYGTRPDDYKGKIKDKEELEFYETARHIWFRTVKRGHFICAGENEEAAFKLDKELSKNIEKANLLREDRYKPRYVKVWEENLEICPNDHSAIIKLLSSYSTNKETAKFNKLMMRLIMEDQVDFAHMYNSTSGEINDWFYGSYCTLIHLNTTEDKQLLTKAEIEIMTNKLFTKHSELFDFDRELFRINGKAYNELYLMSGVNVAEKFSQLLLRNGLYEMNDAFILKFLTSDAAKWAIKTYEEEFAVYLKKWEAAGWKSLDVK